MLLGTNNNSELVMPATARFHLIIIHALKAIPRFRCRGADAWRSEGTGVSNVLLLPDTSAARGPRCVTVNLGEIRSRKLSNLSIRQRGPVSMERPLHFRLKQDPVRSVSAGQHIRRPFGL